MTNIRDTHFSSLPLEVSDPPVNSVVVVAMSGGVDSSLAALLMAERGCRVIGVTMRVYDPSSTFSPGTGKGCYRPGEEEDEEACRRLCKRLGAPYHVIDLSAPYSREILENFRQEYLSGRTPNPCLRCNPLIKFGLLPQALRDAGVHFDYFVTGHYARLVAPQGDPAQGLYLAPAADPSKDQTYFLQRLPQAALSFSRFPLGTMTKVQVRRLALERGLETAQKKDSQDFIASEDYEPLFGEALPPEGDLVDLQGRVLGRHRGIIRYTIGQRRGLGISVDSTAHYVHSIDAGENRIVVSPEEGLYARALEASDALWFPRFGDEPFRAFVKIRLAALPASAMVIPLGKSRVQVAFDNPQRAIAPGQSVAYYVPVSGPDPSVALEVSSGRTRTPRNSILVGGAIIDHAIT